MFPFIEYIRAGKWSNVVTMCVVWVSLHTVGVVEHGASQVTHQPVCSCVNLHSYIIVGTYFAINCTNPGVVCIFIRNTYHNDITTLPPPHALGRLRSLVWPSSWSQASWVGYVSISYPWDALPFGQNSRGSV